MPERVLGDAANGSSILLCPHFLFGHETLHELISIFHARLYAFIKEHPADLRDVPLFIFSNALNLASEVGVDTQS